MPAPLTDITAIMRDILHDPGLELTLDTRFDDVPGWDSMDLVTVVVEIECRFGLEFDLIEIDRLATAGDLVRMVEAKRMRAAA